MEGQATAQAGTQAATAATPAPSAQSATGRNFTPNVDTSAWETPATAPATTEASTEGAATTTEAAVIPTMTVVPKPTETESTELDEDSRLLLELQEEEEAQEAEPATAPATTTEEPAAPATEPTTDPEISAKAKAFDEFLSDPYNKRLYEARKNGEDLESIVKSIKPVDYNKVPQEEILAEGLKLQGLSDEDISSAVEEFKDMSVLQKLQLVNPMKSQLEANQNQRISELNKPNLARETQQAAQQAEKTRVETFWNGKAAEAKTEVDSSLAKAIKEGKYMLTQFTPEMEKRIRQAIASDIDPPLKIGKDGNATGYDVPKLIEKHFLLNFKNKFVKAISEKSQTEGFMKYHQKHIRPSMNTTSTGAAPITEESIDDAIGGLSASMNRGRAPQKKTA